MSGDPAIRLQGIVRSFRGAAGQLDLLRDADLAIYPGQTEALVGPSGAGKSTLLQIAGLLEAPDAGEVFLGTRACGKLGEEERTRVRRTELGFVYQFHHLLPEFTALENVAMPQLIRGIGRIEAHARATELLGFLGLEGRVHHRPSELSGGEQQRVAIARAVANAPRVLLADEPTGNLDPKTSEHVFRTLLSVTRGAGMAALIATHNLDLAGRMDRRVTLQEGRVVELA